MDYAVYRNACKKTIDINDPQKVPFLMDQAQPYAMGMRPLFFGDMVRYIPMDHRFIAA